MEAKRQSGRSGSFRRPNILTNIIRKLDAITIVTWNARALLCFDVQKRCRKLKVLEEISQSAMVIGLQEVHDTAEMFNVFTHGFAKALQIFHSQCDNCAAGGVVLLLRSSLVTGAVTDSALVPGRDTRVSLTYADRAQLVIILERPQLQYQPQI